MEPHPSDAAVGTDVLPGAARRVAALAGPRSGISHRCHRDVLDGSPSCRPKYETSSTPTGSSRACNSNRRPPSAGSMASKPPYTRSRRWPDAAAGCANRSSWARTTSYARSDSTSTASSTRCGATSFRWCTFGAAVEQTLTTGMFCRDGGAWASSTWRREHPFPTVIRSGNQPPLARRHRIEVRKPEPVPRSSDQPSIRRVPHR